MKAIAKKILRPDSKGRVCLGPLAKGISGYKAIMDEQTKEIIQPFFHSKIIYANIQNYFLVESSCFSIFLLKEEPKQRVIKLGIITKYFI